MRFEVWLIMLVHIHFELLQSVSIFFAYNMYVLSRDLLHLPIHYTIILMWKIETTVCVLAY